MSILKAIREGLELLALHLGDGATPGSKDHLTLKREGATLDAFLVELSEHQAKAGEKFDSAVSRLIVGSPSTPRALDFDANQSLRLWLADQTAAEASQDHAKYLTNIVRPLPATSCSADMSEADRVIEFIIINQMRSINKALYPAGVRARAITIPCSSNDPIIRTWITSLGETLKEMYPKHCSVTGSSMLDAFDFSAGVAAILGIEFPVTGEFFLDTLKTAEGGNRNAMYFAVIGSILKRKLGCSREALLNNHYSGYVKLSALVKTIFDRRRSRYTYASESRSAQGLVSAPEALIPVKTVTYLVAEARDVYGSIFE